MFLFSLFPDNVQDLALHHIGATAQIDRMANLKDPVSTRDMQLMRDEADGAVSQAADKLLRLLAYHVRSERHAPDDNGGGDGRATGLR